MWEDICDIVLYERYSFPHSTDSTITVKQKLAPNAGQITFVRLFLKKLIRLLVPIE